MRKSAQKQQWQVQAIKRTVTGIKESQDNGHINNFWKGSRWGPFVISYDQNQENGFLENHICVRAFALVACFIAVLTIPANSAARVNHAKSAKHTVDCMCSFKHAHICINTNAKKCLKALCSRKSMTPSNKFIFDINSQFKNSWKLLISYLFHS